MSLTIQFQIVDNYTDDCLFVLGEDTIELHENLELVTNTVNNMFSRISNTTWTHVETVININGNISFRLLFDLDGYSIYTDYKYLTFHKAAAFNFKYSELYSIMSKYEILLAAMKVYGYSKMFEFILDNTCSSSMFHKDSFELILKHARIYSKEDEVKKLLTPLHIKLSVYDFETDELLGTDEVSIFNYKRSNYLADRDVIEEKLYHIIPTMVDAIEMPLDKLTIVIETTTFGTTNKLTCYPRGYVECIDKVTGHIYDYIIKEKYFRRDLEKDSMFDSALKLMKG